MAGFEGSAFRKTEIGWLICNLGQAYRKANAIPDSLRVLKACLAVELAMGADNTSSLIDLCYELYRTCEEIDPPQAVEFCENWLQLLMVRYGTNGKKTARALSDLCLIRHKARKDDPRALQVGLQAAQIIGPDDGKEYYIICWRLRYISGMAKNWEEAAIWGQRAVESSESEFGTQSEQHTQEVRALAKIYEKDETWYS